MFTGLITAVGEITARDDSAETRFRIATPWGTDQLPLGASIACSGCCLTVVASAAAGDSGAWFDVEVSAESLAKTTLANWAAGKVVNLEPALRMGDPLGGHQVLGHVDAVGAVVSVEPVGDSHVVTFAPLAEIAPLIASKGSIAVDGVSLTVNDVFDGEGGAPQFTVNIIPHTWAVTTLGQLEAGSQVNMEIDPLARYIARFLTSVDLKALLAGGKQGLPV